MRFVTASLLAAATTAYGQVDQFYNTYRFAWGAGAGLPAPYTQADMNVTVEVRVGAAWIPYTMVGDLDEVVVYKPTSTYDFSIPINSITTLFTTSSPMAWSGSVSGQQVTWTTNQTFSQTGGFAIVGSFDSGGTPIAVNLLVNNVATTGSLRAIFANMSPASITTLGRVANVRGTHTGGDAQNYIDMDAGSASGTVAGFPVNDVRVHFRNIQHIVHPPMPFKVQPTVHLGDVVGSGPFMATFDILPEGPGPAEWSWTGPINQSTPVDLTVFGYAAIGINAPANRRLRVRVGSHLSQTKPITLWSTPAAVSFNLTNGDVNHSEEVDPTDLDLVISNFGYQGGGLPIQPDLNYSGEVDPTDIDIVIANFGSQGDTGS